MSAEKPCFICAKEPRTSGKLCDGCWAAVDYEIERIERFPRRLLKAVRAFWTEATRVT